MRLPWIKLIGTLAAIWILVGGIRYFAQAAKPTPERVTRFLDAHPLENAGSKDRSKLVDDVADQLNRLDYEERREVRMSKKLDHFFRGLSSDEQRRFLDLTLPTGFKQMMEALNNMTPEKRQKFVSKALEDMKKHEGEEIPEDRQKLDANGQKIIDQGFRSFYGEASAETKMDVAPLIEQLQKNLQGAR